MRPAGRSVSDNGYRVLGVDALSPRYRTIASFFFAGAGELGYLGRYIGWIRGAAVWQLGIRGQPRRTRRSVRV